MWINNGIAFGDELTGSNVKTWDGEEWISENTDKIFDKIAYGSSDSDVYVHSTSDWSLAETLTEAGGIVRSVSFSQ